MKQFSIYGLLPLKYLHYVFRKTCPGLPVNLFPKSKSEFQIKQKVVWPKKSVTSPKFERVGNQEEATWWMKRSAI